MHSLSYIIWILALAWICTAKSIVMEFDNVDIVSRQIDCSQYGEFEPYTGACETTSNSAT